ncbi:MAG: prolyl oligopeptidase family serine peptidase [Bacteroidaceae bacterium]|nr:prolyl oligopeptidase family serine peptidase [Bacteroidaceae bacterium]
MKRCTTFLFLLFAVLVQMLAQGDDFPVVMECEMQSEILGCTKKYCVYLPQGYSNENRTFPVLYLLHGLTDTHTAWRDKGNVQDIATEIFQSGKAQEMVIVMPDAGTTYDGYFNSNGWRYEDFFFQEFIPYIEKLYRVVPDRQHRAIAGLSMGGGGTAWYAINHSEMFSSAYAMSALMGLVENSWITHDPDARRRAFMESAVANNNITAIGNFSKEQCAEVAKVRWFIDVGDDDFLFDNNMEFIKAMRSRHIPYQLRVREGGHTWQYWQEALYIALPFISESMGK